MLITDTPLKTLQRVWKKFHLASFPPLLWFADVIMRTPIPWGMSYKGHTLYGLQLKRRLGYEEETALFYRKHLKAGEVIADVGASNGLYTFLFADAVGPAGTVVAFEPDATSFGWLSKGARGFTNIRLEKRGVSDKKTQETLWSKKPGHGMSSTAYHAGSTGTEISTTDLKSYEVEQNLQFDWVKIDIEGSELKALRGMRKVRATVEFAPDNIRKVGMPPEEFLRELEQLGYSLHFISVTGEPLQKDHDFLIAEAKKIGVINLYIEPR